jgi:hypothetical protein
VVACCIAAEWIGGSLPQETTMNTSNTNTVPLICVESTAAESRYMHGTLSASSVVHISFRHRVVMVMVKLFPQSGSI